MFSGMTGVVCLPLNQGQVASAGSVTIRTAFAVQVGSDDLQLATGGRAVEGPAEC